MPSRYRLRVTTLNTWFGLRHTLPAIMPPAENPLAAWVRRRALQRGLESLRFPQSFLSEYADRTMEVMCLQELNPAPHLTEELKKKLKMEGFDTPVQVGLKIGSFGWPPTLNEGLGLLWSGPLTDLKTDEHYLSGSARTGKILGIPYTFQTRERRCAQVLTGKWKNRRFTFVNVHLHHGSPKLGNNDQRAIEIENLVRWLEPLTTESDATFIAGDFNCEHGDTELSPLMAAGFEEILPESGEPIVTWDPNLNPRCKKNVNFNSDAASLEWDAARRQFDHIFVKTRGKAWGKREDAKAPWQIKIERVFDNDSFGAWISDHFGLTVNISWPSEKM